MRPCDVRDQQAVLRLNLASDALAPHLYEALGAIGYLDEPSVLWHHLTPEQRELVRAMSVACLRLHKPTGSSDLPYTKFAAERHRYYSGLHRGDKVVGMITPYEAAK